MLVLHSIMLHTCNIVQSKFSNSRAQPLDDGQMIQAQEMPSVLHPHQSNQDSSAIASRYKITQFLDFISFNIGIYTTTYSHVQFSFRPQEVGGSQHQLTTHVQIVPNVVANSMVPTPSMLPRYMMFHKENTHNIKTFVGRGIN